MDGVIMPCLLWVNCTHLIKAARVETVLNAVDVMSREGFHWALSILSRHCVTILVLVTFSFCTCAGLNQSAKHISHYKRKHVILSKTHFKNISILISMSTLVLYRESPAELKSINCYEMV